MVFGFFSRRAGAPVPAPAPVPALAPAPTPATATATAVATASQTSNNAPTNQAGASVASSSTSSAPQITTQMHNPVPSINISAPPNESRSPSPQPRHPPPTPSPAPPEISEEQSIQPQVQDPRALYALINSVPPQTLHEHCLDLLDPHDFDTITGRSRLPKRRRRKSTVAGGGDETPGASTSAGNALLKPHPLLTPETLSALTAFFNTLEPPPQLHCVRCHKHYFELDNTDWSCRVQHDDDSAIVERIGVKLAAAAADSSADEDDEDRASGSEYEDEDERGVKRGRMRRKSTAAIEMKSSIYETLWACCNQTVEGDGDQGPPDGWCYEGRHTTDYKRARFRADSTPHDDKLVSCSRLKCFRPQVSPGSTASPSVKGAAGSTRKRKRSIKPINYRDVDDEDMDMDVDEEQDRNEDEGSVAGQKRRKKTMAPPTVPVVPLNASENATTTVFATPQSVAPDRKKRGRPKKVVKSEAEVLNDEANRDADAMDVDPVASGSGLPQAKKRKPRASKVAATPAKANASNKPVTPFPPGLQDTATVNDGEGGSPRKGKGKGKEVVHRRSRSQVYVDLPPPGSTSRNASPGHLGNIHVADSGTTPARGSTLTRSTLNTLKARGSVASLRDRFEGKLSGVVEARVATVMGAGNVTSVPPSRASSASAGANTDASRAAAAAAVETIQKKQNPAAAAAAGATPRSKASTTKTKPRSKASATATAAALPDMPTDGEADGEEKKERTRRVSPRKNKAGALDELVQSSVANEVEMGTSAL